MDDASPLLAPDPLERARARVDGPGIETLTLASLAAVAALSPYHFARQFTARFGVSPMAYVRERRMALAARRLAADEPPALVDLAFDLGFESQEGFTRAFKRAHGVSPGRYRRATLRQETRSMSTVARAPLAMSATPVAKPAFRVAGVGALIGEANRHEIPTLWPRLIERLPLEGQRGEASFGVCIPTGGQDGCFRYLAGVPITDDAPAPPGLEVVEVPSQTYLVFRQETDGSALHPQMQAAAKEIWGERTPNSGFTLAQGPDIEAYPPGFQPDRPSYVEWWIPVEA